MILYIFIYYILLSYTFTFLFSRFSLKMTCYRGADKSLSRLTSRFFLVDGENIYFDASLVLYIYIPINSTNIPPIMITNSIYEHQNLLSL
jgi:hypothetical protein